MLALLLIATGILLRFAPHTPNFTPVAAIALFGGVYLHKKYSIVVPLALMVISDIALGMHNVVAFTWGGFIAVVLIGFWVRRHKSAGSIFAGSVLASVVFYIVSNFGVWLMGWYPRDAQGLVNCYVMALPFLRTFTVATVVYSCVFFGAYALIARSVKETRFAKVLLEG